MPDPEKTGLRARFQLLTLPIKIVWWVGLLTITFAILGFLVAPPLARIVLEKKLPPLLHRPVTIGKITLNPFSLEVAITDFHLGQKEGAGDLIAFDRLAVNLEASSLFRRALIIQAISLSGPRLEFSRISDQTYSFSDLLTQDPTKKAPPSEPAKPFQFAIRNIEIKGGRLIFHDLPKKTDHTVTELNLGIPALSNLPYQVETYVQPAFSATINGTSFALGGQSKPFAKSLESVVELKASGIKVPEYLAYIPNPTGLLLQSARLDIDASLRLLARPDNTYRLALVGRVALRDLAIADKAGQTYLQVPELAITLADSDLLAREVHLTEFTVKAPTLNLERLADGRLLPMALLAPVTQPPAAKGAASTPTSTAKTDPAAGPSLKLDIDKVLLSEGRIAFKDAAAGATVSTGLEIDTNLHLQNDNLAVVGRVALRELLVADKAGRAYLKLPELALTLAEGNLLANELHCREINLHSPSLKLERLADGRLLPLALLLTPDQQAAGSAKDTAAQPEPAAASPLSVAIDKIILSDGRVDYLDSAVGSTLSTRLEVDSSLHYLTQADMPPRLTVSGRMALRNLDLADKGGKSYLKFSELALELAEANLLANEVHCREISLVSPTLNLERLADGRLLPMALLIPAAAPPAGGTVPSPDPAGPAGKAGEALKLAIDKLSLRNGQVDFLDLAVAASEDPVHLTLGDLSLQVAALSNTPEALASLTLAGRINASARLQLKGQLGLEPLQTRLHLQLLELALKPFQAYISQQARLVIAGGALNVSGDLALRSQKGGALKSDFTGEAAVTNLATVDTIRGEDLLKWRNLGVKKINFSSDPGRFSVGAIELSNPYLNVLFGQDGVLNLSTIVPEKPATATPETPPEATATKPFATSIGSITVSNGQLDFLDRQVEPAYGTTLGELSGSVSDLSSLEESSAEVKFSARLDQQAPMQITGRINPLRKDLFVDLKVDFADINLSPMSPYGGKFMGYKIDKGKLNLDLKYDIANRKLSSQNKVFLDQFTLGQTVDSPDAANLPIRLALALLRDRKGGITLDLPVEGSLDDPSFKIGKVVIQVLINLISKAATSPVALLGSLIPAGQDIQFIAFEAGRAELTPESLAKLTTAEKVLFERPELRMDLIGKVDPAADTGALARQHLATTVKLQKLLAGGKGSKEALAQVEGVELSGAEYPTFLTLAYQAAQKTAKTAKPAPGAPPPDIASMEASLLGTIKVDDDELRLLALARANKVLGSLVAGGKVEPGRLFVIEPKVGAAGEATAISQVELVIK